MGFPTTARSPSIVPPYILRAIARNGTPQQRDWALHTLALDVTMRSLRQGPWVWHEGMELAASGQKRRSVYDAKGSQNLPGTLVRKEGDQASADKAVNEAYNGLGVTYDFYHDLFGRDSIDGKGLALQATVHFGNRYNNAFWNGTQMVFGDGDGVYFNRFTVAPDVIGHELTHGVTEVEAALEYNLQPGALNESVSDVFGSLVKQRALNQTAEGADWLIGAGLFTARVQGVALRSMKAPGTAFDDPVLGKDQQPAHMKDYVNTLEDNGGVHINSGIPNHAFYLAAQVLGGYAWEKAGKVWYETLRDDRLRPRASFSDFATLTFDVASKLYGARGKETKAVQEAWKAVGVDLNLGG